MKLSEENWLTHIDGMNSRISFPDETYAHLVGNPKRAVLICQAPKMLEMLLQLEWCKTEYIDGDCEVHYCPRCAKSEEEGHHERCDLARVIRNAGGYG